MKECGECKYFSLRSMFPIPRGLCTNEDSIFTFVPCYCQCECYEEIHKSKDEVKEGDADADSD